MSKTHWAIYTNNRSDKKHALASLMALGKPPKGFEALQGKRPALFSQRNLDRLLDEEDRHGDTQWMDTYGQSLVSMSSGERKKVLLEHLLQEQPDYMILDNPFDNLDTQSQKELAELLLSLSEKIPMVQLSARASDMLPILNRHYALEGQDLVPLPGPPTVAGAATPFQGELPPPPPERDNEVSGTTLVQFRDVSVSFGAKKVLDQISWQIDKGSFWQLVGENGSGKSTLLSLITGDSPKAYGQDLFLFGFQRGSGESVWDIKKHIGYFSPAMLYKFSGYHTVEHMLISGLYDSVGLYQIPGELPKKLALQWMELLGMLHLGDAHFNTLSMGQQRLIMVARAMIKHPPLLILDEPTTGLDDPSAAFFVAMVNKIAAESDTAIIFVSHRPEEGLKPQYVYQLSPSDSGSTGAIV